ENIRGVGRKYETKDVAKGYAMNFLLPQKKAREATDTVVAELSKAKEQHEQAVEAQRTASLEKIKNLSEPLIIRSKANEQGHLFASVSKEIIIDHLFEDKAIQLDPEALLLQQPLKEVGTHTIPVAIGEEEVTVVVEILAE